MPNSESLSLTAANPALLGSVLQGQQGSKAIIGHLTASRVSQRYEIRSKYNNERPSITL